MKKCLSLLATAAILAAMSFTLSGCTLGKAMLRVTTPSALVIQVSKPIDGKLKFTLDGIGKLTIAEIKVSYLDDKGKTVSVDGFPSGAGLPTGVVLPDPITLVGALGIVSVERNLSELIGEVIPTPDWWALGVPHPTKMLLQFFNDSSELVGAGDIPLAWADPS